MLDAGSLPSSRGRRILVALLALLLILLPLYLWPLRGRPSGLLSRVGLSGLVGDPRSPAAVAALPDDVWDALMGGVGTSPPPSVPAPAGPRNLTMITELEDFAGSALAESSPLSGDPSALARSMITRLEELSVVSDDGAGVHEWHSTPEQFPAGGPGAGTWPTGFASVGYPSHGDLGPWTGGGPGGSARPSSSTLTFDLGGHGPPQPTPEPATLILVGSNLALLGAAAWKRRRQDTSRIG